MTKETPATKEQIDADLEFMAVAVRALSDIPTANRRRIALEWLQARVVSDIKQLSKGRIQMATIEAVEITNATDDELEVTMRGKPEAIIQALVSGVGGEALVQIRDAMDAELRRRRDEA
jgi:hypothetical protein